MCVFLVFHALTRWLSARCLPTACLLELLCYIFVVSYRILLLYMHVFVVVRALSRTLSRRPPSTDRIYHLIFDFIPMDSPFISTLWLFQPFSPFFSPAFSTIFCQACAQLHLYADKCPYIVTKWYLLLPCIVFILLTCICIYGVQLLLTRKIYLSHVFVSA